MLLNYSQSLFGCVVNVKATERPRVWKLHHSLEQGSPDTVLEGRCPAEFSSNPNQTHLKQLINVLLGILETSRQVCWGKLELNSAGHRPSRIKFGDPCSRASLENSAGFRHLLFTTVNNIQRALFSPYRGEISPWLSKQPKALASSPLWWVYVHTHTEFIYLLKK